MATIKHIAGKPNSCNQSVIYTQYVHRGKRLLFSTSLKINSVQQWDKKNGKIKKSHPEFIQINEVLQQHASKVNQLVLQCRVDKIEPTIERIRHLYNITDKNFVDVFTCLNEFIDDIKSTKAESTISIYQNVLFHLKSFAAKENIEWDNINHVFLESFSSRLFNQNLASSTVKRNIAYLKSFLNYAFRKGLLKSKDYETFSIRVPKKDVISLTENELGLITAVKLPEHLSKVRDAFCFSCLTGLRYSDLKSIKKEAVQKAKSGMVLKIQAHKTKSPTTIPVLPRAQEILKTRQYQLVSVSHQRYLKLIKKIAKLAGINRIITTIEYKGGGRVDKQVPKYQTIGSHTARRTYISLSLQKGIPVQLVASITHNGNISSLMRYIAIDEERKIEVFNKAWSTKSKKV